MSSENYGNPIAIRDATFDLLFPLEIDGVPTKVGRKVPLTTLQPDQLPALGVYISADRDEQLGNVTLPQFETTLEICASWVCMASDDITIDGALDLFFLNAKTVLFSNPDFLGLFEFVTTTSREYNFTKNGEAYIAEVRLNFSVTYKHRFDPLTPFDFKQIVIKGSPPVPDVVIDMN